MKKCRPRWAKIAIDWVERELTAVMAVAIVLAFIFTQSLATDTATQQSIVSTTTGEGVITQQSTSTSLWTKGDSILFGRDIDGQDVAPVVWAGPIPINLGTYLMAIEPATVNIPANSGSFTIATTFEGTVTVNGVRFTSTSYATQTKNITISNGVLTVALGANSKIHRIETKVAPAKVDSGGSNIVPTTTMTLIPNKKTIVFDPKNSQPFTPLAITTNAVGALSTETIVWASSDTTIAAVNDAGVVTPKAPGIVTITASVAGNPNLKASTTVTVQEAVPVPTVEGTNGSAITNQPTTNGETTNTEGLIGRFVSNLMQNRTAAPSTDGTTTGVTPSPGPDSGITKLESVLDAFAAAQATKLSNFGTTQLTQGELNAVINTTQNTATGKIVARARLAVAEIGQTLREIAVGRQVTMKDGTVAQKKSAAQLILNWIKNTFFGGVSATPLSAGSGSGSGSGEDLN